VHRPGLLLADEPTGNLDPTTAAKVMDALIAQTREHGASLVLVTHSEAAAGRADRVLHLSSEGISA
jgi:putative ABC transport system ATP-binding protein